MEHLLLRTVEETYGKELLQIFGMDCPLNPIQTLSNDESDDEVDGNDDSELSFPHLNGRNSFGWVDIDLSGCGHPDVVFNDRDQLNVGFHLVVLTCRTESGDVVFATPISTRCCRVHIPLDAISLTDNLRLEVV